MNTKKERLANALIANLLGEYPAPTVDQWKQLIAEHPECAGEIADAAMLVADTQPLSKEDYSGSLNHSAYESTLSKMLTMLHTTPGPILKDLEKKVSDSQGAASRNLAEQMGLSAAPVLLTSVMAGSVVAPTKILKRLALRFETSVLALSELFGRTFALREIPSFKTKGNKPHVSSAPTPWKDAVQKLGLPAEQTQELLNLDD